MNFNKHSNYEGKHAFLSASKYHWINYDIDKLTNAYLSFLAIEKGTILHDFASRCIKLNQRLPRSQKSLNMFVNDAIGFKMESEQILFYSDNCFGTADAISFRDNTLRIHDLKTGAVQTHMEQLLVYAALFCLEYNIRPSDIFIELRIYQFNEVAVYNPKSDEIEQIIDKIIQFDKVLNKLKEED